MTATEAQALVTMLVGAYPRDRFDSDNAAVYREFIAELASYQAAQEAVLSLIRTERWLPSIADIREEYQRHIDKHQPKQLPEPELDEKQRRENLERLRRLASRVGSVTTSDRQDSGQGADMADA